jgi:hypothetical protein
VLLLFLLCGMLNAEVCARAVVAAAPSSIMAVFYASNRAWVDMQSSMTVLLQMLGIDDVPTGRAELVFGQSCCAAVGQQHASFAAVCCT